MKRLDAQSCALLILVTLLIGGSVSAQYLIHAHHGAAPLDHIGKTIRNVGDMDQDGVDDYLQGSPFPSGGTVTVYSGATHAVIHSWTASAGGTFFGHHADTAGDVNADGFPDVIIGAEKETTANGQPGAAYVMSGMDGSQLHHVVGDATGDFFGWGVAGAGDVNADGFHDFVVGAPFSSGSGLSRAGQVKVFSGYDGSVLFDWYGNLPEGGFGTSVLGAGDCNNDGREDVAIGAPGTPAVDGTQNFAPPVFPFHSEIQVRSGLDGTVLHSNTDQSYFLGVGWSLNGIGDLDQDGVLDFSAGGRNYISAFGVGQGTCRVFSGASGTVMRVFTGPANDEYGLVVVGTGDLTGDGVQDLAISAPSRANTSNGGYVEIRDGVNSALIQTLQMEGGDLAFGWDMAEMGDLDGDNSPDIVLAVPHNGIGGFHTGSVMVLGLGTPPRTMSFTSGSGQATTEGTPFASPVVVTVTDTSGAPVAGASVQFSSNKDCQFLPDEVIVTDAQGQATVTVVPQLGGPLSVGAQATGAALDGIEDPGFFARFFRAYHVQPNDIVLLIFNNDVSGVPILIAADAPLGGQGYVPTVFGDVYTSLLNPTSTLSVIDGFGVFGPADPGAVTSPNYFKLVNLDPATAAAIQGVTRVMQVYGFDSSKAYPGNFFMSNPQTVTF